MDLCGVCGRLPRGAKSASRDLRARACPRFDTVDMACCTVQECARIDARGAVRCDYARWAAAREVRRAR